MLAKTKTRHTLKHHRSNHRPKKVSKQAFERVYWPYLPVVLFIAVSLVFSAAKSGYAQISGSVLSYATTMSVGGLLSATNTQRGANGVAALGLNDKLDAAAQAKANDMAARNYWSHNTPEGNPPWVFVTAQGYSYLKIGENLAAGFADENATITGWMNSPAHRENMLDPAFSQVGFGFANNANYTSAGGGPMTIVVAYYGEPSTPPPPPPPVTKASTSSNTAPPASTATVKPPTANQDTVTAPGSAPAASAPPEKKTETTTTPVTTASAVPSDVQTKKVSRMQLSLGDSAPVRTASSFSVLLIVCLLGLWAARHFITLRRAFKKGEKWVLKHPALDIVVLSLAIILYLTGQTVGLIQ